MNHYITNRLGNLDALCLITTCAIASWSNVVDARSVPLLTYEQLYDASDVVLIADAMSSKVLEERGHGATSAYGMQSVKLRVHLIFKGEIPHSSISLIHIFLSETAPRSASGQPQLFSLNDSTADPALAELTFDPRDSNRNVRLPSKAKYLFFLKQREDGTYQPATGQGNGAESIKLLCPP